MHLSCVRLPCLSDRFYFDIATPIIKRSITNSWNLSAGSQFRQYAYGDNTAQYVINQSAELNKTLGENSNLKLNYRLQLPNGASPFRFDYFGKYNNLRALFNMNDNSDLKLSVIGGYNFEQSNFPWQDAIVRVTYQPSTALYLYTSTGYDFNRGRWRNIVNLLRIDKADNFNLQLGSRYDPFLGKLAELRGKLEARINDKTRIRAFAGYNGFTNTYDYTSFMITRDLHCWKASLVYQNQTGFYENKSIMLNLSIKAFPSFQSFGNGIYGEEFGSSVGDIY